jgi:hypothetical protein
VTVRPFGSVRTEKHTQLPHNHANNRSRKQPQRSITAGLRWDVRRNTAIKAELAHVRTDSGAYGTFIARGNPFAPGLDRQSINLMSISIDVVF